jgi:sulfur relay protein TusB/DsrH
MLVIIRSAPDTVEGKRGIKLAGDMSASLVLLQNGVYFIEGRALDNSGFAGRVYVLADDKRLRGIQTGETQIRVSDIDYDGLVDLMTESSNVVGMF